MRACARRGDAHLIGAPGDAVRVQVLRPAAPRLWPLDPVQAGAPFTLAWTGVPNCAYYELQESTSAAFDPGATKTTRIFHPGQKVTLPGRPAGRLYFRVKAVDQDNQASAWSDPLAVEVQ